VAGGDEWPFTEDNSPPSQLASLRGSWFLAGLLGASGPGFVSVVLYVKFGCLVGVMSCVLKMSVGGVCVMGSAFVVACLMVFGRFAMMSRRVLVVLGCFMMMLCGLFRHGSSV